MVVREHFRPKERVEEGIWGNFGASRSIKLMKIEQERKWFGNSNFQIPSPKKGFRIRATLRVIAQCQNSQFFIRFDRLDFLDIFQIV